MFEHREPTNSDRADWAAEALNVFCVSTYDGRSFDDLISEARDGGEITQSDASTAICDLIGNLMHLAARYGLDPHDCVDSGTSTFELERDEESSDESQAGDAPLEQGNEPLYLITVEQTAATKDLGYLDQRVPGIYLVRDYEVNGEAEAIPYAVMHLQIETPEHFRITCEVIGWDDPRSQKADDIMPF